MGIPRWICVVVFCFLLATGFGMTACGTDSEDCAYWGGKCVVPLPDADGDGCFNGYHPQVLQCGEDNTHCCLPN